MKQPFHITKKIREKYQISDFSLYSLRRLAKALEGSASSLNAIILIHKIFHYLCLRYREEKEANVFKDAFILINQLDKSLLERFTNEFQLEKTDFIEELLLLNLAYENPSFSLYKELLSLEYVKKEIIEAIFLHFEDKPPFGPFNQSLPLMLSTPQSLYPFSLKDQLIYIKDNWGYLLSFELLRELLLGLDLTEEEERLRLMGKGKIEVLDFKKDFIKGFGPDDERFSKDADWMREVVMLAKNTYVWLFQLSKKYSRPINRLSEIPDCELDTLKDYGFNALWLIGLWERSNASKKIKQMCGNPEAISSAYSLYDYTIASDLGGEEAFENFKSRCWQRGIRLAGDMVPNHIGIYSRWIVTHPDWFIQLDYPPFPRYSFTGPNLSEDNRVGIYLEDGYFTRSDAAVCFKRVDHLTGEVKYIYHGNDGTHMPWNDTAQLNFLKEEVREAVIQTILYCARKFPIIRFDAAMILTKFHYQRLWFPEPGTGGAIPSRAEFGMTKEEFDRAFPKEFWKEVVDRVALEIPDTLLLAEAFWLMEGYFVRTLGMHRVYNSAFMNMLKMEENAKYRSVIKNILEYNPRILERLVNFMSNPDEESAIAQFGKDDKYFGVCLMMVTLPGLPMFSHGQIEGFSEKYGMEYKRAYWDETPDLNLMERHKREIFPLLKKRYLFSGVSNFFLFDVWTKDGYINENVFCYSNRFWEERALIVYNNRYEKAAGFIKTSSAKLEDGRLIQKDLADCLGLKKEEGYYYIFRDHKEGKEYIRSGKELSENGLYIELDAFKYHIFLDFREIYDKDGSIKGFSDSLNGSGVLNIEYELKKALIKEEIKRKIPEKYMGFLNILSLWQLYQKNEKIECSEREAMLLNILSSHSNWDFDLEDLLQDSLVKSYIQLNEYQGILYFHKESFEELINSLFLVSFLLYPSKAKEGQERAESLIQLAEDSEYQLEKCLLIWKELKEFLNPKSPFGDNVGNEMMGGNVKGWV